MIRLIRAYPPEESQVVLVVIFRFTRSVMRLAHSMYSSRCMMKMATSSRISLSTAMAMASLTTRTNTDIENLLQIIPLVLPIALKSASLISVLREGQASAIMSTTTSRQMAAISIDCIDRKSVV